MNRIDAFVHDALLEVMVTAERSWWLRRAEDFERAKPRIGDFHGAARPDALRVSGAGSTRPQRPAVRVPRCPQSATSARTW